MREEKVAPPREVIILPLGYTADGALILARIAFSHSLRPGMLQRLSGLLDTLAPLADEPIMALDDEENGCQ